ncbi:hypothetical protein F5887DRAFT_951547 [Amanita rubescens]|nr:hypothetical protein F5887DRAFT_951547 [Amanita rubescens]
MLMFLRPLRLQFQNLSMAKLTSTSILFLFASLIAYYAFALPLLRRGIDQLESDLELFFGDTDILSDSIASFNPVPSRIEPHVQTLPSEFALTNNDLQQCIDDLNKIKRINIVDATIVLKLMHDFQPSITGMLKNVRSKKSAFKKLNMVSFILGELEMLQSGVAGLMGELTRVVPSQFQGEARSLQANMGAAFHQTISLLES